MTLDANSELELKFPADGLSVEKFLAEMIQLDPTEFRRRDKPFADWYHEAPNGEIVRWRQRPEKPELTIKRRKSADSTTDRVELDLKLFDTNPATIARFLHLTGFKPLFGIEKTEVHVFEFVRELYTVEVVLYLARRIRHDGRVNRVRNFVEIEIAKTSNLNKNEALAALAIWGDEIGKLLDLPDPINQSLFEIFSGRRYNIERDHVTAPL